MISNLIVFSTLFLGVLFTILYVVRPEFRARIEQPKYAFLQQLSMYDKSGSIKSKGVASNNPAANNPEQDRKENE